jgi:predicted CXXCH cytochrome family protein
MASAWVLAAAFVLPAHAQDADCVKCHADHGQKKFEHAAMAMGCKTCHSDLDASTVPHKLKGKFAKGLSAEGAALCNNCHEAKMFQGKVVHAPVASGMCTSCHDPHGSDNAGLLTKAPAALCLDCHSDVKKKPHLVAGFSSKGHPIGDEKKPKEVQDPLRPGKPFYCAACHEPHAGELPRLSRFGKGMGQCQKCHKM